MRSRLHVIKQELARRLGGGRCVEYENGSIEGQWSFGGEWTWESLGSPGRRPFDRIIGFWTRCLGRDEIQKVFDEAVKPEKSTLAKAFDAWIEGRDVEAKALLKPEEHYLLEGLIVWDGKRRPGDTTYIAPTVTLKGSTNPPPKERRDHAS